jgi:hypothetical protein
MKIDFLGAVISTIATICLMLGLTWGSSQMYAWNSPQVIGLLVAGAALFALLIQVERKAAEPILPLELFRNQVWSCVALLTMLQMMVLMGLSLFLQGVLVVSPTAAGLVMTPLSVSMVIGAIRTSLPAFLSACSAGACWTHCTQGTEYMGSTQSLAYRYG